MVMMMMMMILLRFGRILLGVGRILLRFGRILLRFDHQKLHRLARIMIRLGRCNGASRIRARW